MHESPNPDAPAFTTLPDLASRALAGSVVYANDELFAQRENLITPGRAVFSTEDFGHKGKVYDGWETRRRREPGHDWATVRLGVPGVVHGVNIDTSWFKGNYPPYASVEAASFEWHPSVEELEAAVWVTLVEKSPVAGDTDNYFAVDDGRRYTHLRLTIYPDGGVARFRVHGDPVPDPRFLTGTVDLAALENGGSVVDCSNMFYSSPTQILQPGRARIMGEGWENARRRDDGNDHVTVKLAAPGLVRRVEIDTSYFVGNAAGWARLSGVNEATGDVDDPSTWSELIPKTRLQPDTRHFFRVRPDAAVTHVRLDVYPDGGLARLRVNGEVDEAALRAAVVRWLDLLPENHAVEVLSTSGGLSGEEAEALVGKRPFGEGAVPDEVVAALLA
ncbi:MAG TPA: allantoicase [Lapillicoccus sp.]|nr:allantoicase [Lapillicoccus sp.]